MQNVITDKRRYEQIPALKTPAGVLSRVCSVQCCIQAFSTAASGVSPDLHMFSDRGYTVAEMKKSPCIMIAVILLVGCNSVTPTCRDSQVDVTTSQETTQPESTDRPKEEMPVDVTFTGILKNIEMMGKRETTVYPAALDPRFVIFIDILDVSNDKTPLKPGEEVRLAIHSPCMLFAGDPDSHIGRKCKFRATWETGGYLGNRFDSTLEKITLFRGKTFCGLSVKLLNDKEK